MKSLASKALQDVSKLSKDVADFFRLGSKGVIYPASSIRPRFILKVRDDLAGRGNLKKLSTS